MTATPTWSSLDKKSDNRIKPINSQTIVICSGERAQMILLGAVLFWIWESI